MLSNHGDDGGKFYVSIANRTLELPRAKRIYLNNLAHNFNSLIICQAIT